MRYGLIYLVAGSLAVLAGCDESADSDASTLTLCIEATASGSHGAVASNVAYVPLKLQLPITQHTTSQPTSFPAKLPGIMMLVPPDRTMQTSSYQHDEQAPQSVPSRKRTKYPSRDNLPIPPRLFDPQGLTLLAVAGQHELLPGQVIQLDVTLRNITAGSLEKILIDLWPQVLSAHPLFDVEITSQANRVAKTNTWILPQDDVLPDKTVTARFYLTLKAK